MKSTTNYNQLASVVQTIIKHPLITQKLAGIGEEAASSAASATTEAVDALLDLMGLTRKPSAAQTSLSALGWAVTGAGAAALASAAATGKLDEATDGAARALRILERWSGNAVDDVASTAEEGLDNVLQSVGLQRRTPTSVQLARGAGVAVAGGIIGYAIGVLSVAGLRDETNHASPDHDVEDETAKASDHSERDESSGVVEPNGGGRHAGGESLPASVH